MTTPLSDEGIGGEPLSGEEIASRNRELAEMLTERIAELRTLSSLRNELVAERDALLETVGTRDLRINELERELASVHADLQRVMGEKHELDAFVAQQDAAYRELAEYRVRLDAELASAHGDLSSQRDELDRLRGVETALDARLRARAPRTIERLTRSLQRVPGLRRLGTWLLTASPDGRE